MAGDYDISDGDLAADIREARDKEWRAVIANMRSVYTNVPESDYATGWHEACDAVARLMEAKR